jgi:MFS family permease
MIYPLLPNFLTRTLRATPAALGLIEGTAEATASIAKLVSGWWADRSRRRKPLVVIGYSLSTLARPLVAFANAWTQVLAIRFADRLGKGVRSAPRDALLADLAPIRSRGRAFGLQRAMDDAGAVVGPLLAALLLKFFVSGERTVFLLAVVPGLAALVLLVAKVRERPAPVAVAPPARAPGTGGPLPARLRTLIAIYALFTLANARDAFLILRARDAGVELWQLPLLWAFFNLIKALVGVPAGELADRIGRVPVLVAAWVTFVGAYLGFAFAATPATIWGLFGIYAVAPAMWEPAERSLLADLAAPEHRGRAFGFFYGIVGIAALPASLLFGVWWKLLGAPAAFGISAVLGALAAGTLIAWSRAQRKAQR